MTIKLNTVQISILAAVLLAGISGIMFFSFNQPNKAEAGSLEGDYATTTTSAMASGTATVQLKTSNGALGYVTISSSSPITTYPQITIYDATSTMATSTSKVLARFGTNNQTMGTYMFDAAAAYGLKVEVAPGYSGNATITWR